MLTGFDDLFYGLAVPRNVVDRSRTRKPHSRAQKDRRQKGIDQAPQ